MNSTKPALTKFWLMKTEPEVFSITDLKKSKTSLWEGVRNYQARNFMVNDMQVGQGVLLYHSSTDPSGVAGIATVSQKAIPDPTQFDRKSAYYDPKATREKPIWFCVEVKFVTQFSHFVSLAEIKANKNLAQMMVVKKGSRLSIQPVTKDEFEYIHKLGIQ